jgi:hypothetical protein
VWRRARRLAWAYLIVAIGLIVWTVFLALSLPKENLEQHYRLTWVGFDLILALAVYLTAHMAFRLDARVGVPGDGGGHLAGCRCMVRRHHLGDRESGYRGVADHRKLPGADH